MLPFTSVVVQVTVVVPTEYGDTPLLVVVEIPQLSAVTGTPNTTALDEHNPASALMVTSAAQAIVGTWLSVIVTVYAQVAVLPLASLTK